MQFTAVQLNSVGIYQTGFKSGSGDMRVRGKGQGTGP